MSEITFGKRKPFKNDEKCFLSHLKVSEYPFKQNRSMLKT